jgi:hypothetical protein
VRRLVPAGQAAPPRASFAIGSGSGVSDVKGFLGRLFGGQEKSAGEPTPGDAVEYNGYRIRPAVFRTEGQFQTAGVIEKDSPDGTKVHRFIRAETHGSADDAAAFALIKGKQIVDQNGDRIFDTK